MRPNRFLSALMILCVTGTSMIQSAQAALVSTEQAAAAQVATQATTVAQGDGHARLAEVLGRAEVQAQLERLGVGADQAQARVAALSDEEAAQFAEQIDSAPAGSGIVGALLLVFFVLLVTDILGLTKIFPFTRSVR